MASTSDPLQDSEAASSGMAPLRAKWGWIVALGAVHVIAGFFALGSIAMATVASVLVVGVAMIVAGVAQVINAFRSRVGASSSFGLCSACSTSSRVS
jgi:uncharacterized membrane protein HdeD (DUF308 family)